MTNPARRILRTSVACAALGLVVLSGCYVYVPVQPSGLVPNTDIAVDLNDQGRVGLSPQVGPEVRRISGKLLDKSPDQIRLQVADVTFVNGTENRWTGEPIGIRSDFVGIWLAQKLSIPRTAAVGLTAAAAVGAMLITRSLLGSGTEGTDTKKGPTQPPTSFRGFTWTW